MSSYRHILVVVHPEREDQPALQRALLLAQKLDAKLLLTSCIYDTSHEMTSSLNHRERCDLKQALVDSELSKLRDFTKNDKGLQSFKGTVECEVIWDKKFHVGIIAVAKQFKCDLIVKSVKKHNKLAQKLFTPNDWHLLRNSSVNVLMVKHHDWPTNGKIISAIGLDDSDDAHECLSIKVLETSKNMAHLLEAEHHLVNTYPGAPVHISVEVPQFSAATYNANLQQHRQEKLDALAVKYQLPCLHNHVIEGLPEDIIPGLCNKLDAELLVLGSVGRRGLSAAVLGNTAEHIIDNIDCDTLIVKP